MWKSCDVDGHFFYFFIPHATTVEQEWNVFLLMSATGSKGMAHVALRFYIIIQRHSTQWPSNDRTIHLRRSVCLVKLIGAPVIVNSERPFSH